jgi:hypothetical protein
MNPHVIKGGEKKKMVNFGYGPSSAQWKENKKMDLAMSLL